ncbi:hypothetical protein BKA62DRAFT_667580 [Auriculariales sp. MPI-PUGE-AT-0066]|nr:hypothetical protein BKA62DRAFT_667580 [Auriculariales sp. MPI-PUGE-AT-0066]
MPPLTLRYFDIRARAEPLRILLVDAGADFVDERVPFDDAWTNNGKLEQPFSQLPTLDIVQDDGTVFRLPETIAITDYIEETYCNIPARSPLNKAKANAVRDASLAFIDQHWEFFWADNFPKADAMQRREARTVKWLSKMSAYLSGVPRQYLYGEPADGKGTNLTGAATWLFEALEIIEGQFPGLLAESDPELAAIHKAIAARPRIAAYLAAGKGTKQITLSDIETEERKAAGREAWLKARKTAA